MKGGSPSGSCSPRTPTASARPSAGSGATGARRQRSSSASQPTGPCGRPSRSAIPPTARSGAAAASRSRNWSSASRPDQACSEPRAAVPEAPAELAKLDVLHAATAQLLGVLVDDHEVDDRQLAALPQDANRLVESRDASVPFVDVVDGHAAQDHVK